MLAHIFTNAINSAVTPWFYKKLKLNDYNEMRTMINGLLLIVAVITFCLMVMSPELILLMGSEEYIPGQMVIPPVAASVFFIFLYGLFSLPQFYYEKTKFLMLASVGAALLNLLLNFVFINKYGFVAAGYTTLVCYVVYSIGHYIVSMKVIKMNGNANGNMFDRKLILVTSLFIVAVATCIHCLFPYRFLRYLLIILLLFVGFAKRDRILSYLKIIKKDR